MAKERRFTRYFITSVTGEYHDGDGDEVTGLYDAKHFDSEASARKFADSNERLRNQIIKIVQKGFRESELLDMERSYEMHMRRKKQEPSKP